MYHSKSYHLALLLNELELNDFKLKSPPTRHPLILLLKFTGIYFGERSDGLFWYYFGLIRAFLMCTLTCYQTTYLIYYVLSLKKFDEDTPLTVLIMTFHFQSAFSMIFLIHWQFRGYLKKLFANIHWPDKDQNHNHKTFRRIRLILVLLLINILFSIIYMMFILYAVANKTIEELLGQKIIVQQLYEYDHRIFQVLAIIVMFYSWNISVICLAFYNIISYLLLGEYRKFNIQLEQIGKDATTEDLDSKLLEKYSKHINMSKMVQTMDKTFKVYTFVMIATNIPITIFSLINIINAMKEETGNFWAKIFIHLPKPLITSMQLIGLIAIPAKLHSTIQEVKNILYSNTIIWQPYNEKIYQIANAFVSQIERANLGISVWSFTVITKPLILTTISLTLTYLTLIIELEPSRENRNDLNLTKFVNQFLKNNTSH